MSGKQHLRGVSAKEQREYEHIEESGVQDAMVSGPRKWLRGLC